MLEYNDTADEQKPDRLYVDDIGVGGGVVDRLREQGVPVSGVTVSRLPPVRMAEKCYRLRDELWWRGREFFQGRNVRIPREEGLLAELTTPTYDIRSDGRIHVESKADFKKRLPDRGSPDSADAFLLTFMSQNDTVTTGQREQRSGKYRRRKKILSWMAA